MEYSIVDICCKHGNAIQEAENLWSSHTLPPRSFLPNLGIDIQDFHDQVLKKGYQFLQEDVTTTSLPKAECYVAWDALEHLPSVDIAKHVLSSICKRARVVWLRMPSFEDEPRLEQNGLRWAWTDWSGHKAHVKLADVFDVLPEDYWSVSPRILAVDTNHDQVVPVSAPKNTIRYSAALGEKPFVQFDPPLVGQWELIARL